VVHIEILHRTSSHTLVLSRAFEIRSEAQALAGSHSETEIREGRLLFTETLQVCVLPLYHLFDHNSENGFCTEKNSEQAHSNGARRMMEHPLPSWELFGWSTNFV